MIVSPTPTTAVSRWPTSPDPNPPTTAPIAIARVSAVSAAADRSAPAFSTRLTKTGPPMMAVASV